MEKPQILLTNDDGIRSPGLWAAASALSEIGYVQVAAPRDQFSSAGRSMPITSDGVIEIKEVQVNEKNWQVYSVGGTPAQTVQYAILEILPAPPALLVSGINYGENVGPGVTISGTVGAALEGASMGIPSLAISLETAQEHHYSYSNEVDFSAAAFFTRFFGQMLLEKRLPADVDVLKVDVPMSATPETPWKVTRISRKRYFEPVPPKRSSWDIPALMGYRLSNESDQARADTDSYALRVKKVVSVTPLSLDITSRVDLKDFERLLRS